MSNYLRLASLVFLSGAVLGCGGDDGGTATATAHLTGRAGAGAAVQASSVTATGAATPLADATAGADGRYALEVELPADAVAIVVRAGGEAAVVSDAELAFADGAMLALPPLDGAATATTDVYLRALADGDDAPSLAMVALTLTPAAAAEVAAAADRTAAVTAAAAATREADAAWSIALTGGSAGAAGAAANAMVEAELAYAAALDRAGDAGAAYAMYAQATVAGFRAAGYDAADLALAADAAAVAMADGVADNASARLGALVAAATTASVDARVSAIASVDWSAVTEAGATLRAAVASGAGGSATVEAFATYQAAVAAAIAARTGLAADVVVALTRDLEQASGALAVELKAAASASAIVDAFVAYRAAVASDNHVGVLVGNGWSEASARAALGVLADVEAATL